MTNTLTKSEALTRLNALGRAGIPFCFVIDYEMQHCLVEEMPVSDHAFSYNYNGKTNRPWGLNRNVKPVKIVNQKPLSFPKYEALFEKVQKELQHGNSFLLNLTLPTRIELDVCTLADIYESTQARYKLMLPNQFVAFSPEPFVQIRSGKIFTYPMKGTINASISGAKERLLANEKEKSEHCTIVDLLRNDLNRVSKQVQVERFRYLSKIEAATGSLWQTSSCISGQLPSDHLANLGHILFELLPAGSICGAPKTKTCQLIKSIEPYPRSYYTGVCGLFDGENLDSGVLIRYIEQKDGQYYYRSGGGITHQSNCKEEYQELIDKIYVPTVGNHMPTRRPA